MEERFNARVNKPVLITSTKTTRGLDIFGLRVGIYKGYDDSENIPYEFYNFSECHTQAFCRYTGLWLNTLNGIMYRPRSESIFLLKDVDAYVDYKFSKWRKEFGSKIRPIRGKESMVDGSSFIKVDTNNLTYFTVGISKLYVNGDKCAGYLYRGSKDVVYEELKSHKDVYFFTNADLNRLKEDIKEMYRNLNKVYESKVKDFYMVRHSMFLNGKQIV